MQQVGGEEEKSESVGAVRCGDARVGPLVLAPPAHSVLGCIERPRKAGELGMRRRYGLRQALPDRLPLKIASGYLGVTAYCIRHSVRFFMPSSSQSLSEYAYYTCQHDSKAHPSLSINEHCTTLAAA